MAEERLSPPLTFLPSPLLEGAGAFGTPAFFVFRPVLVFPPRLSLVALLVLLLSLLLLIGVVGMVVPVVRSDPANTVLPFIAARVVRGVKSALPAVSLGRESGTRAPRGVLL